MARERERIFSLSRFATQAETEADEAYKEAKKQAYTRIYGGEDNIPVGKELSPRVVQAMMDDDAEYQEPARSFYPEDVGIVHSFGEVPRKQEKTQDNFDDF